MKRKSGVVFVNDSLSSVTGGIQPEGAVLPHHSVSGIAHKVYVTQLSERMSALYLLVCQVRVTVGDSGLCCCCCLCACVCVCVCVCVHACVRACARVCVCVRACVRACVRVLLVLLHSLPSGSVV